MKTRWKFFHFVFLMALSLMLSCASKEVAFNTKFNELQSHMTFDQVKQLIGPPDLRELKGTLETWHYLKDDGRVVLFEGGQVTAFGKDGVINSAANNNSEAKVIVAPRAIGESCKVDNDCIDKNCHFHICSGKDNCQVPVGGVCANNVDCCGGFCDFSVCKIR